MKKKIQTYSKNFKMPYVFLNDLKSIEKVIKEELDPERYKLESLAFEYKEVSEISEDNSLIYNFHIQTYSPYININFTKKNASIYAGNDDIKTIGAIEKIVNIIHKRERNFLWYSSRLAQIFALPLLMLSFFSLSSLWLFKLELEYSITISTSSTAWFLISIWCEEFRFSVVEFTHKKNRSSFLFRNKDQIIVGIIVAIFSILGTLLLTNILR